MFVKIIRSSLVCLPLLIHSAKADPFLGRAVTCDTAASMEAYVTAKTGGMDTPAALKATGCTIGYIEAETLKKVKAFNIANIRYEIVEVKIGMRGTDMGGGLINYDDVDEDKFVVSFKEVHGYDI